MGHKSLQRQEKVFDALTLGEHGLFIGIALAIFMMPRTLFRLARLAWQLESKQGGSDHHKRIVGTLIFYAVVWLLAILAAAGAVFVVIASNKNY